MKFCCKGFPLGKARAGSGRPEAGGRTIELGARAPARDRHVYSCCLTQASLPAKADEPPSRSVPCVNSHRAPRCLIKLLLPDFEVSFMKPRARAPGSCQPWLRRRRWPRFGFCSVWQKTGGFCLDAFARGKARPMATSESGHSPSGHGPPEGVFRPQPL